MSYHELGLLSMIILWTAVIFMLRRWKGNRSMSVSMHAASARPAYFLSAFIQTSTGVMLLLFMTQWLIPHFHLPLQVTLVFLLGTCMQILAAWIPDSKGHYRSIHRICAFGMASLMPVIVFQTLLFAGLTIPSLIIGAIAFLYMILSSTFFIFTKSIRKHFLPYQIAYVACFHIFILSAAYLG